MIVANYLTIYSKISICQNTFRTTTVRIPWFFLYNYLIICSKMFCGMDNCIIFVRQTTRVKVTNDIHGD